MKVHNFRTGPNIFPNSVIKKAYNGILNINDSGLSLLEKEKNMVFGKFNTEGHFATMAPVFSFGTNSESFKVIYENTEIFEKLKNTIK